MSIWEEEEVFTAKQSRSIRSKVVVVVVVVVLCSQPRLKTEIFFEKKCEYNFRHKKKKCEYSFPHEKKFLTSAKDLASGSLTHCVSFLCLVCKKVSCTDSA